MAISASEAGSGTVLEYVKLLIVCVEYPPPVPPVNPMYAVLPPRAEARFSTYEVW